MKKLFSLNVVVCFTALIVVYVVDLFLVKDNFLQSSVLTMIDNSHYFRPPTRHVFIHAVIPLYIAFVTFSAWIIGALLGFFLHRILFRKRQEMTLDKVKLKQTKVK